MNNSHAHLMLLLLDIQALEDKLHEFERRYRLRSDVFHRLVQEGKLEQSTDFILWLGLYETYLDREAEYELLLEEKLTPMLTFLNQEAFSDAVFA